MTTDQLFRDAAQAVVAATHVSAFTGAGISVESGIPPFRGEGGLWSRIDPALFEIRYFLKHQTETWHLLREIFFDLFGKSEPNGAHIALAELERMGYVKSVITQNIDSLHQRAGSVSVVEFHGTARDIICMTCHRKEPFLDEVFDRLPPVCEACGGVMKPDFIFFGEGIPQSALNLSLLEAMTADCFIVIGTTGEVYPAAMIPMQAKDRGATIIEVNTEPSSFTSQVTDIFLQGKASEMMGSLLTEIKRIQSAP